MNLPIKANFKLAIGLPALVYLACFGITFTSLFQNRQHILANAILLDLLITAPFLYFLVIRKTSVSKKTIIRVFVLGVIIAGLILNTASTPILYLVKSWLAPALEIFVIGMLIRKFFLANKQSRLTENISLDFLSYAQFVMKLVTGSEKAGNLLASEISVLYYAFMGAKAKQVDYKSSFTSYKENGILLVLGTFLSLFLFETIGFHFLLSLWNKTAAWLITGLSAYTCLQLFAHIRAIKARHVQIIEDGIFVHNGLAGDAYLPFDLICKIEHSKKTPVDRNTRKIALIRGLENHNMVVYLVRPIQVTGIFGIKKWTDTVLFFVDKPALFIQSLPQSINQ